MFFPQGRPSATGDTDTQVAAVLPPSGRRALQTPAAQDGFGDAHGSPNPGTARHTNALHSSDPAQHFPTPYDGAMQSAQPASSAPGGTQALRASVG